MTTVSGGGRDAVLPGAVCATALVGRDEELAAIVGTVAGTIIDIVATLGIAGAAKAPKLVAKIKELWDAAVDIWTRLRASMETTQALLKDFGGGQEPPCPMEDLAYPDGSGIAGNPTGYRHPGDTEKRRQPETPEYPIPGY